MLPQNGHQQLRSGPQPSFSPVDSASFILDSPQVAKQMAALTAANQQRMSQNTRIMPSSLPTPGGTSSAPFLGPINPQASFPLSNQDLLTNSVNGHAQFPMHNNFAALPQNNNPIMNNSFLDSSMAQSNPIRNQPPAAANYKQRQQNFLNTLAHLMVKRGTPLPPALTGVPVPNYDPSHSIWSLIEPSEIGSFRLAGKDVDIVRLWMIISQHGGGQTVNNANAWGAILSQFDLPDEYPDPQTGMPTSVAGMLAQYYMAILFPMEEMQKKGLQDQQKKAQSQMISRQGPMPNMPNQSFMPSTPSIARAVPPLPNTPQTSLRPTLGANGTPLPGPGPSVNGGQFGQLSQSMPSHRPPSAQMGLNNVGDIDLLGQGVDPILLDQDTSGMKRKHDQDDKDVKRARQKTDPPENSSMSLSSTQTARSTPQALATPPGRSRPPQPSRRKIEYIPLAREVDTYGGRDLKIIEAESQNLAQRRPLRDFHEWGMVEIEALTMSLRSRLAVEMSYAITTLTLLSTMRVHQESSGFPLALAGDLLDELLDLVEQFAFPNGEEESGPVTPDRAVTNRELVNMVHDTEGLPFAVLQQRQGSKDPSLGPLQRPGDLILAVSNIIRNLSQVRENQELLSHHPRVVDLLLRLSAIELINGTPAPLSKNISLVDLLLLRKDTIYTLANFAGFINLSINSSSSKVQRITRRTFELVSSYLSDSEDAAPPFSIVQCAGAPSNPNSKPPPLADVALEVFTRWSQTDSNRQIITKYVPQSSLWLFLTSLVRRLPLVDADFYMIQKGEWWLNYIEKLVLSIYSVVFLASQELKQKIRTDRRLAFKSIMVRMIHKALMTHAPQPDGRGNSGVFARRAIEALKLLDKPEDVFENKKEVDTPVLSFGMGFTDAADAGGEKGTGILGGNQELGWDMLMLREVLTDEQMFNELESLVRVECS